MVDLDYPLFFADRIEDAVPPCSQAPQNAKDFWSRFRFNGWLHDKVNAQTATRPLMPLALLVLLPKALAHLLALFW